MGKRITYAITVCNEISDFQECFNRIHDQVKAFRDRGVLDDIVVQQDIKASEKSLLAVSDYISTHSEDCIKLYRVPLNDDFATYRNRLNSCCTGDYIFQVDADERISENVGEFLHEVIDNYPELDLIAFPRENRVEGITSSDIEKWGWTVTEKGINWPDYQFRFYRNSSEIYWKGKVHERPVGFGKWTVAPEEQALKHFKDIEKQRTQNEFYTKLRR